MFIAYVLLLQILNSYSSNIDHVNPLMGTYQPPTNQGNYGGMIPSVSTPFGMTRWTAMTQENNVGSCPYIYNSNIFNGFLATHQPAVWMGESAEIAISAGTGNVKTSIKNRGLYFDHNNEISKPQYYKTIIDTVTNSKMNAEISATSRASIIRFSFDKNDNNQRFVTIQASRNNIKGMVNINVKNKEISGYNPERQDSVLGPFTATDFKGYFVARFDKEFKSYGTANDDILHELNTYDENETVSAYVEFDNNISEVNIHVGISFISIEQARQNLLNEINEMTLEEVTKKVEKIWSDKLDLITITNATTDDKSIFYTSMYHALQYPYEMNEYNSSGSYYYSGFDNKIHAGDNSYTGYSIWDTFRSEWAFLNLFAPERINGMIQSMLQGYKEGGRLPIWQNIVETNIMIGTHSSSLIAESLAKGFNGFDINLAWEAVLKDAMIPPKDDLTTIYYDREEGTDCEARAGLTRELKLGYVAAVTTSEAGSRTLEYAYDDYTIAVIANLTNHQDRAPYFIERSKYYKNIFNNDTMFMEAKYENGTWCSHKNTWTEADEWVYTFNVQHDFVGLRELFHGKENFEKKLDAYYNGGHNDQTNEPSHATVFAYLYANAPYKAQTTIRSLLKENYFNNAIGLSGNDDCGQMASWYIFNTLGFYPVNPASAEYIIGTPLFDKAEITFPQNNHKLIIHAEGAYEKEYVENVNIDGQDIIMPVLNHQQLLNSNEIKFTMNSKQQTWGMNTL